MIEFLIVGLGGFIGACLRFAITKLTGHFSLASPLSTLISNVAAGLVIGFILGLEQQSIAINTKTKLFLTTGLLGGLSTFSTFSLETVKLFQDDKFFFAACNIALNVALSLFGVLGGMVCAKAIFKKS
ncbi:MAG: fluoride efflux transporter CrcB [Oscillospiraceae bacterium]|jgi:CrcB protein|nr:fluoride efflux transporter CrcB [Oscillospiraceae bacterium]